MEIPLTQGKVTIIDDIDADLADFNWFTRREHTKYYPVYTAVRNIRIRPYKQFTIRIHRVILERIINRQLTRYEHVDHINHNELDNRRENLRIATIQENCCSQRAITRSNKSSRYKGVSWDKNNSNWRAYIQCNKRKTALGSFKNENDAARAYNIAAMKYYGQFGYLNIIEDGDNENTTQ